MKLNNFSHAELWIHDNSIAVIVRMDDGSSVMQVLHVTADDVHGSFTLQQVNFAGLKFFDEPVRCHKQVQNSRRYAQRNLF